jgi:3-oxoacyl-[acyl-carrier-protein] synthase II
MKAVILGLGWINSSGFASGRSAKHFEIGHENVTEFPRQDLFPVPNPRFGRIDRFSKTGLVAIALALKDLEQPIDTTHTGIIAATQLGCLQTDIQYFETVIPESGKFSSPNLFAYTLPTTFLGEATIQFQLKGENLVLGTKSGEVLEPLKWALMALHASHHTYMLAGCNHTTPEGISTPNNLHIPGALFFVLGRLAESNPTGYGILELFSDHLEFNGNRVDNLIHLAQRCIQTQPTHP